MKEKKSRNKSRFDNVSDLQASLCWSPTVEIMWFEQRPWINVIQINEYKDKNNTADRLMPRREKRAVTFPNQTHPYLSHNLCEGSTVEMRYLTFDLEKWRQRSFSTRIQITLATNWHRDENEQSHFQRRYSVWHVSSFM